MDAIDKINIYLAQIGKTGADMSRAIGLSNSVYSQWNTKKTKPSKKTLAKVAEFLGVSVEEILPDPSNGQKNIPTLGESEESVIRRGIIAKLDEMSDEELEKLLGVIDLIQGSRNP